MLLELHFPGSPPTLAGILLFDPASERIAIRLTRCWRGVTDPDEMSVFEGTEETFRQYCLNMGPRQFVEWIEGTLSNVLRVSSRLRVDIPPELFESTADSLHQLLFSGESQ